MEANNSIARNLVYQRKLKGLTQKDLSDKTNVTVRTIQRIEKGETEPHLQTVKLIAAALEIEVDELIPLEDPKKESVQQKWLLMFHATPFIGFVLPFFNIFIPLFLWIHKREDNPVYYEHGRKVINFQLSIMLYFILIIGAFFFIGHLFPFGSGNWSSIALLLFISIIPFSIVVMLFNIFRALKNLTCFYPLSIPFITKRKRLKTTKTVLTILIFLIGINYTGQSQNIERLDGSMISSDSLTIEINRLMDNADIPGLAFTVFNENKPVFSKSFGYRFNNEKLALTDSSNIYGASLSKA
ncbi:MAG: helix-turn-helix domain-containing protein, partial [Gramella sp.]|nr:helix-turn-helix domain-containing protein [Christiangramia sp.]